MKLTTRVLASLDRYGVGRTWGSLGRIGAWVAVWVAVVGVVVRPAPLSWTERDYEPDVVGPADRELQYLGPTSPQDYAGFLAPEGRTGDTFTVAWIGGSELKWNAVSVPAAMAANVSTVGGRPLRIDVYSVIAPRPIDVLRAMRAAIDDGADALLVSLNPAWVADEWAMRGWPNTDVSDLGGLLASPTDWLWEASLVSPSDVAWRVTRNVSPIVEAQTRLNERAASWFDRLDVVDRPADDGGVPVGDHGDDDPRLPADGGEFWIVQEEGPAILDDLVTRLAAMTAGFDDDTPVADHFAGRLLDTAESADVPVLMYSVPMNPDVVRSAEWAAAGERVESFWQRLAADVTSPVVEVEPGQLGVALADGASYIDLIHTHDPVPIAAVLTERICEHWATVAGEECA